MKQGRIMMMALSCLRTWGVCGNLQSRASSLERMWTRTLCRKCKGTTRVPGRQRNVSGRMFPFIPAETAPTLAIRQNQSLILPFRSLSSHRTGSCVSWSPFHFDSQSLNPLDYAVSQARELHSLQQFSYANVNYQQYLENILEEYHHLSETRSSGGSVDQSNFVFLETVVPYVEQLRAKYAELADLRSMATAEDEKELQTMAKLEVEETQQIIDDLEEQLVALLVGPAPADKNDIILEVSAGVGGQEAMLFTTEMFNMYAGYASYKGWTFTEVDSEKSDLGGVRRASALITGVDVYKHLKFEAGVHRVQRVPRTEKSGRIHTSTMTVAVLPQPTQIDISVNPKDLQIDTFRSGGAGGQHVNTTESAVRITHKPTGVVAECQQERSQIRNREVAMKTLLSRLYQRQVEEQEAAIRAKRKLQMGSKGRSEKIRTYNYSQDRITDHRGPITLHNVQEFLSGEDLLDGLVETLLTESRLELLHAMVSEFIENQKHL